MTIRKICCLGLGLTGVPLCAVIANKCPEIKVTVVHTDPEKVFLWNAKQIPESSNVPGLADLIRKSQNKNLFFTTNGETSIKEADMIFITSNSKLKTYGEGKDRTVDLSMVEEAALIIGEHAEAEKIIVENSAIPLKTAECIRKALSSNSRPGVTFQVLSNPEFYEEGTDIQNLLLPERVLIGCEDTPEGHNAAKELAFIYERWVVPANIITRNNWATELSKISNSALDAQRMANIYALSVVCEEFGANILEVTRIVTKDKRINKGVLHPCLSLGKLPQVISTLIYMCESMSLLTVADYWKQVLEMMQYHKERFLKRVTWALYQTTSERKMTVFGFAHHKDAPDATGSGSADLCKHLLEERAKLNIYDPKVSKAEVIQDLISAGCKHSAETLQQALAVCDDPYISTQRSEVIVLCATCPEFADLDYERIYKDMVKPAYVFDSENILPHSKLLEIGFKVFTVGKFIKNK